MQFTAQHQYYQEHYIGADFQVILADGHPAGRLYVARWPDEIRIVDIALITAYRNAGIGAALLKDLLAEGARAGKPVSHPRRAVQPGPTPVQAARLHPDRRQWCLPAPRMVAGARERGGLIEHGLIAEPIRVPADRHDEQVEGADLVVLHAVDTLGKEDIAGATKDD